MFYANLDVHDLILREWSWLVSGDDWSVEAVFAKDFVAVRRVGDFLRLEKMVECDVTRRNNAGFAFGLNICV